MNRQSAADQWVCAIGIQQQKPGFFHCAGRGEAIKKEFAWLEMLEYGTMPKKRS
jgi:hypothetical protein